MHWLESFNWFPEISTPVALLLVATIAYFYGRRQSVAFGSATVRSRRELRRAQAVARELENISELIRKHVTKHRATLSRFKQRVNRLDETNNDAAMRDLFREAEEILQPTIQFAGQIAHAYDQIRQQTDRLMAFTDSRTDPLTGVSNRRALDDTLSGQLALKARYQTHFTLAMFDIDHFKRVNDRDGHLVGDRILQDVAQVIEENARETDTVVRYGGEEFVVVMPETDLEGASFFGNRVREAIQERLPVTLSGGVTQALDGDSVQSIIARADAALYEAKAHGRDTVYRHDGQCVECVLEQVPVETAQ
ncbi:MAG TPA: GGDEF domain-containing protein [Thermoguttaceae bacterium]|nr:GGDEF domain-containing protein [Thermoguttaceae bacterium]